jgi:hypothetical protein
LDVKCYNTLDPRYTKICLKRARTAEATRNAILAEAVGSLAWVVAVNAAVGPVCTLAQFVALSAARGAAREHRSEERLILSGMHGAVVLPEKVSFGVWSRKGTAEVTPGTYHNLSGELILSVSFAFLGKPHGDNSASIVALLKD